MAYAAIALVGLLLALGFTFLYIYHLPKLVEGGAQGLIFYPLLIPWALSSAAFLFGAMRSYANFTHRHLGGFLELGGPVALFCLVLLGGLKLVPRAPETFDLAVRAHSVDTPLVTSGQITLELPGLPHANIVPDGEANFKGLPTKFQRQGDQGITQSGRVRGNMAYTHPGCKYSNCGARTSTPDLCSESDTSPASCERKDLPSPGRWPEDRHSYRRTLRVYICCQREGG